MPIGIALLLFSGLPIPLGFLAGTLESRVAAALGCEVSVRGPVTVALSSILDVRVRGIELRNLPDRPDGELFLSIDRARVKLRLRPALLKSIEIKNLEIVGVRARLETRGDGGAHAPSGAPPAVAAPAPAQTGRAPVLAALDALCLRDWEIAYRDGARDREYRVALSEGKGVGGPDVPFVLTLEGTALAEPFRAELTGMPLRDLLRNRLPWTVSDLRVSFGAAGLRGSGRVQSLRPLAGQFDLSVEGDGLDEFASLVGSLPPGIGPFCFQSGISIEPGQLHLAGIEARLLDSSLAGDLLLSVRDDRPFLAGSITARELDLARIASLQSVAAREPGVEYAGPAAVPPPPIPWDGLKLMDANVLFHCGSLSGAPVPIVNLSSALSLSEGILDLPFSGTVLETEASGHLHVDSRADAPRVAMALTSSPVDLSRLVAAFAQDSPLRGRLGRFSVNAAFQGRDIAALLQEPEFNLELGHTTLYDGASLIIDAHELAISNDRDGGLRVWADGWFRDRPFRLSLQSGGAADPQSWPLRVQITACESELEFASRVLPGIPEETVEFQFSSSGKGLCGLLDVLEEQTGTPVAFAAAGHGALRPEGWELILESAELTGVEIDGRLGLAQDEQGKPVVTGSLHAARFDLRPFLPGAAQAHAQGHPADREEGREEPEPAAADAEAITQTILLVQELLDREWLPADRPLLAIDAKLDVHLEELETGRGLATDMRLAAEIEDGRLARAPFEVTYAGERLSGDCSLDSTGAVPTIHVALATDDFDLSEISSELGVSRLPDITAGTIRLELTSQGRKLPEILAAADLDILVRGGHWTILRRLGEQPLEVAITRAAYHSSPGIPVTMSLDGDLNSVPLSIALTQDGLFANDPDRPFNLRFKGGIGDTELSLQGKVTRRVGAESVFDLQTVLSGSRLDRLNDLLGVGLPPLGPYLFDASLRVEDGTAAFHDALLHVEDSVLRGEMVFSVAEPGDGGNDATFSLDTKLDAETVQLDNFPILDWLDPADVVKPRAQQTERPAEARAGDGGASFRDFFDPAIARQLSGSLEVRVGEVLSGSDRLGGGLLRAGLRDGLYSLDAFQVDFPGGMLKAQAAFRPGPDVTSARLAVQMERMDYGVLIRRVAPASDLKGELNLGVDLRAEADTPGELKNHLNGFFRLGVNPEEYRSGVIDLWAVNVLTSALPVLTKSSTSEINCLAGNFVLEESVLRPETFFLDTSRIRAIGRGQVDFKTGAIAFELRPRPKSPQFFSLSTPVTVSGSTGEFSIGVPAQGILGTLFRQFTSVVVVPLQWLFSERMAADGAEDCADAMSWVVSEGGG